MSNSYSEPNDNWNQWIICGSRGSGKTYAAMEYMNRFALEHEGVRMAIISVGVYDGITSCYDNMLKKINPDIKFTVTDGNMCILWSNGSIAAILGTLNTEDEKRLQHFMPDLIVRQ